MAKTEHPFAQYVRILGRGPTLSRPMTLEEAEASMAMILAGEVEPEQLGAYLMLLRVNAEVPEEIAGFVRAAQSSFKLPANVPEVDLDWSSYAGKRRQLPFFILAALALAGTGVRILMQGVEGHTPGRMYTREILEGLGIRAAASLEDAAGQITRGGFSYIALEHLSPVLHDIIGLKSILGLRSPVHTMGRMLNPFGAPYSVQGIFHPPYMGVHQGAAHLLGQPHMAVFRGDGGEVEVRPNKSFEVRTVHAGEMASERWPRLLPEQIQAVDAEMNPDRLAAIWAGDDDDDYARAAITGTLAVVLKLMERADSVEAALETASEIWNGRDKGRLSLAS